MNRALVTLAVLTPVVVPDVRGQVAIAPDAVQRWEQLAPLPGASVVVTDVAETAADPGRLYLGTFGGVMRSNDGGASWTRSSLYPGSPPFLIMRLAASPVDADTVVLANSKGVWRSTDAASTWVEVMPAGSYGSVAFAELSPQTVYVAASSDLLRSDDGGVTFVSVLSTTGLSKVRLDPTDPARIAVRTFSANVHVSVDGGATWTTKTAPIQPFDLAFHGSTMLIGGKTGAWRSDDDGDTWTQVSSEGWIYEVAIDGETPGRLYLSVGADGLHVSDDSGATWTNHGSPALHTDGANVRALLASRVDPDRLIYAGEGGVFVSPDDGVTFTRSNAGLEPYATVRAVAVDPFSPSTLLVQSSGTVYTSHDGGASWVEASGIEHCIGGSLSADRGTPGRYYLSDAYAGIWRSDDWGATFQHLLTVPGGFEVLAHPTVGGRVFALGGGLWRSDDGAATFVQTTAPVNWTDAVAISPVDTDVMFVASDSDVFRSTDGGATWAPSAVPPATLPRTIACDPLDPDLVHLVGGGCFRSTDGGATWSVLPSGNNLPAFGITSLPAEPGVVVTGALAVEAALRFDSDPASPVPYGRGLGGRAWAVVATSDRVYAGTFEAGVWRLRL